MKKSIFIISLILLIVLVITLTAKNASSQDDMPSIPVVGKLDPENNSLITSYEKFREMSEQLSEEESRKQFLEKKWTVIFAETPILGPALFYSEKFFIFLNPLWKIAFEIEFSWSWIFIMSLGIWVLLIGILYQPSKALTSLNSILSLVVAIIIATIVGSQGVIKTATKILAEFVKNIWMLFITIIIVGILYFIYSRIFKQMGKSLKKEKEAEKLEKSKKAIEAHGEVSKEALDEFEKK